MALTGIARTRNQGLKLPTGGGGGGGGPDLILDGHGFLDLSERGNTLRWKNFVPDEFGFFNLAGNEDARWKNFRQSQGTLNLDDEIALTDIDITLPDTLSVGGPNVLRWKNFKPPTFGTPNLFARLGLVHLFQWAENVTNTGYNNPNNALGRSDNTFADSTTDASDDTLDLTMGAVGSPFGTGLRLLPQLTQGCWSYQTNQGGLLALLGEQYRGQFRVLSGGALRTVFNDGDGVLVVPAGEEYGQTAFGGQRMFTDDANVRSDINALTGTDAKAFIDGSLSRLTHVKGIALPQGDMSVDAACYSLWFHESPRTTDATSNKRHGLVHGQTLPTLVAAQSGFGNALRFEGVDRAADTQGVYLGTNEFEFAGSQSFSVRCWLRRTGTIPGSQGEIVCRWQSAGSGATTANWLLDVAKASDVVRCAVHGTAAAFVVTGTTVIGTSWHFAELSYDHTTTTLRLFVDGVFQGKTTVTGGLGNPNDTLQTWIGRLENGTLPFTGDIDDVEILNVATRTTDGNYTPPSAPATAGASTVGLWPLDEYGPAAPTIVTDYGDSAAPWTGITNNVESVNGRLRNNSTIAFCLAVRNAPEISTDFSWIVRCSGTRPVAGTRDTQFRFLCPANNDAAPCFAVEMQLGTAAANDRLRILRIENDGFIIELAIATPTNGWIGQTSVQSVGAWLVIDVTNMGDASIDPRIGVTWYDRPGTRNRLFNNVSLARAGIVTNTSGFFALNLPFDATQSGWADDLFWVY